MASGYCADMTRTFCVGEPPQRLRSCTPPSSRRSSAAPRRSGPACPGRVPWEIACDVIEAGGYRTTRSLADGESLSEDFFHGLGHGVGLEVHEAPYLGLASARARWPATWSPSSPASIARTSAAFAWRTWWWSPRMARRCSPASTTTSRSRSRPTAEDAAGARPPAAPSRRSAPGGESVLVQHAVKQLVVVALGGDHRVLEKRKRAAVGGREAVAGQVAARLQHVVEQRQRPLHLLGHALDLAQVGRGINSSASIALGACFQTRSNQSTKMRMSARRRARPETAAGAETAARGAR